MTGRPAICFFIFFLALCGCARSISKDTMAKVDTEKTFSVVMQNPQAYIGSTVLWGGVIESIRREAGETKIIVSQAPLDLRGYPRNDASDREFIAHTPRTLDPQTFRQGSEITLVGEIDALEESSFGGGDNFPVVRIIEIHTWTRTWGRFSISRDWEINQTGRFIEPGVR